MNKVMNSEYKDHIHDVKSQFLCQVNQVNFPPKNVLMKVFFDSELLFRTDALLLRNRVTEMHLFYYQEKYGLQGLQQFLPEYDTKIPPNFCFFIFHFRVTAILALTLLLTIGRISLELSWHCIHYKNLLVT